MIHMTKLHVGLLIVICTVEFIDASCLSYGHSCWGAHGKRSNVPQRETKPGEPGDRWALFKLFPERTEAYQYKKLYRGNFDNEIKSLNMPPMDQPMVSSEEMNLNILNDDKDISRHIEALAQDNDEFQQRQVSFEPRVHFMKPQLARMNKPNFEQ